MYMLFRRANVHSASHAPSAVPCGILWCHVVSRGVPVVSFLCCAAPKTLGVVLIVGSTIAVSAIPMLSMGPQVRERERKREEERGRERERANHPLETLDCILNQYLFPPALLFAYESWVLRFSGSFSHAHVLYATKRQIGIRCGKR